MIDRTTKFLLAVIAVALLLDFASPFFRSNIIRVKLYDIPDSSYALDKIADELSFIRLQLGEITYHLESCGCP